MIHAGTVGNRSYGRRHLHFSWPLALPRKYMKKGSALDLPRPQLCLSGVGCGRWHSESKIYLRTVVVASIARSLRRMQPLIRLSLKGMVPSPNRRRKRNATASPEPIRKQERPHYGGNLFTC